MKITVSNIAWSASLDKDAYQALSGLSVSALEIAPTRFWPDWQRCTLEAARSIRDELSAAGFEIPSLQAILFAKPDCKFFETDAERTNLKNHLILCADLAATMGAKRLVFGAPKNRQRGNTPPKDAFTIAKEVFSEVAPAYERRGICLCLEANPTQYACDFITDSRQAAELVRAVDSPGFRLHLDTACMALAGEVLPDSIHAHRDILAHFHVSEPNLGAFSRPSIDHQAVAKALRDINYQGWVSLEMREAEPPLPVLTEAVQFVQTTYGRGL